jgi:hypothetical protein
MLRNRLQPVRRALVLFLLVLVCACAATAITLKEEIVTLGKLQDGVQFDQVKFANDGWCAYVVKSGKQAAVVVGDVKGKLYDEVKELNAISNGPVAYAARTGQTWRVIKDGVEGPEYTDIKFVTFSPDGKRIAYAAQRDKQWRVVVDGAEGKLFDDISGMGEIRFDVTGKRLAYAALVGTKAVVVIDGEESETYDSFQGLHFSPDGTRFAYGVKRGKEATLIVDGVPGPPFEEVFLACAVFSPDSNRVGYYAMRGGKPVVVVDGQVSEGYQQISPFNPAFSPDSKHVAYIAQTGNRDNLFVDGVKVPNPGDKRRMTIVCWPQWGTDSKRLACWTNDPNALWIKGKWQLILDNKRIYEHRDSTLVPGRGLYGAFSPAATRFAVDVPLSKSKRCMLIEGVLGKEQFDHVIDYWFTDENTLEVLARRGLQIVKMKTRIKD